MSTEAQRESYMRAYHRRRIAAGLPFGSWSIGDTHVLREMVLEHVSRDPIAAGALFARVRDDYGTVGERRLWRALTWQVKRGAILVVEAKYGSNGQRFICEYIRGRSASRRAA